MTVSSIEYYRIKRDFFSRHKNDFQVNTSEMDEYDRYHKEYVFSDGAIFYEVMSPEWASEEVEVEIKKVRVKANVEVKLFKTEFWSSDDSVSRASYEKW